MSKKQKSKKKKTEKKKMSGKRRAAPSVTTTDIAGSKEIQGLFLNMIANQLARKTQQRSREIAKPIRQETKPQILAARWIGNYLFENGMTKTLSTVSAETGGVIKTIGLPYPIAEDFKFRGNKPFFRQLVNNLRPNLDKPRPLPKPASTTVVGTEVSTTVAQPAKSRDIGGKRHAKRDATETEDRHHHHHHHSKRDSGRRHHHHRRETETETYESRRHHRRSGHGHHHRREEPTYSESYVSTSTYGAVKARDIPKTKPVSQRPKAPGKLTFKERVARLLMKSNLAVETSFEFELQGGMDGYYPASQGQPQVFQPPTAKSATSRTGIPSDQYYEEEDEEEDGYYYDASTHKSTRKTESTAKTSSKTPSSAKSGSTSTKSSSAKSESSSAAQPSSSKKSSTKKSDTSSSSGDEGASASDPEAEEDEEDEEEDHKGKNEEEEEEEEDHGEEEGEGEE